jgi:hypothetical protein
MVLLMHLLLFGEARSSVARECVWWTSLVERATGRSQFRDPAELIALRRTAPAAALGGKWPNGGRLDADAIFVIDQHRVKST